MTKVIFVQPAGDREEVDILPGLSIMEAAVMNGVSGIEGECGGSCICGTCHVLVDPAWLTKLVVPEAIEAGMLETLPNGQPNSRLSCQIKVSGALDGMVLRLPA